MEAQVPFNHISLGNVLEIITMIVIGVGFIYGMRGALSTLGLRMQMVEKEVKKVGEVLITLGRYEERFLRIEDDIWELKRGRGFITDSSPRRRERTVYGRVGPEEPPSTDPDSP